MVDIDAQLVRLIYKNSPTGVLVNIAVAALLVWVVHTRLDIDKLMLWFLCIVLVNILRLYNYRLFMNAQPADEDICPWQLSFMIGALVSAGVWGATPWLLGPLNDMLTPMILAFTLGGLMAGAAAILGSVLKIYLSYTLIIMGPITWWFFQTSDQAYYGMGAMLLVAIAALTANGFIYRRVLRESIEMSNDLILAKEEAEQANKAKSLFLSRMSHELRTPLSSILGYAQLVQEQHVRGTQNRAYMDEIVDSSDHLLELINDLLDLSRIETKTVELDIRSLPCAEIVDECVEQVRSLTQSKKVQITTESELSGLSVMADHRRLRQIMVNLLTNVCAHSAEGARLCVGVQRVNGDCVEFFIDDMSSSLPESTLKHMFLSQHSLGRKESAVEGTGLGLMISQQLIELMHGYSGVRMRSHGLVRFFVQLPKGASVLSEPPPKLMDKPEGSQNWIGMQ